MKLDFMLRLQDEINNMNLYAKCHIGVLDKLTEDIAIMAMPGGNETVFFDGTRDKDYNVQINTKSEDQNDCIDSLTKIYQKLENLNELPSQNGSYDFQNISTNSLPSLLMQDEKGFFIYELSIVAKITIYEGVEA